MNQRQRAGRNFLVFKDTKPMEKEKNRGFQNKSHQKWM